MIQIRLSEIDFDYEIQALVCSFFPGQRCLVALEDAPSEDALLSIHICLGSQEIVVSVALADYFMTETASVTGEGDWHKHEDKSAHPYRTYYKNVLKKLVFLSLQNIPEEKLVVGLERRIPEWGTMTGVRPTKIPMNALLAGKSIEEVERDLKEWYLCTEEKRKLCMDIAVKEAKLLSGVDFEGGYSLYIGIPFCPTTCLYCSFTSYPYERFGHLADEYLEALLYELREVAGRCKGHKLTSIYIGGGTPTTLSALQLERLLAAVRECFGQEESYEFTVEAGRPDSITREKLQVLRKYQVERISVNPQTMQQKTLDFIGRRHSVEETIQAFTLARELGFTNINMDLIIGLPGETLDDFKETLAKIHALKPDSITVHSLVIKRASRLRSVLEEQGDYLQVEINRREIMEQMYKEACRFAGEHGYAPYYMYRQKNSAGHFGSSGQENIGFSKEGKECLYNILIMEEMQTILAVGAGASTKIYHPDKKIVRRVENVKNITDYISRIMEMAERKKDIFKT